MQAWDRANAVFEPGVVTAPPAVVMRRLRAGTGRCMRASSSAAGSFVGSVSGGPGGAGGRLAPKKKVTKMSSAGLAAVDAVRQVQGLGLGQRVWRVGGEGADVFGVPPMPCQPCPRTCHREVGVPCRGHVRCRAFFRHSLRRASTRAARTPLPPTQSWMQRPGGPPRGAPSAGPSRGSVMFGDGVRPSVLPAGGARPSLAVRRSILSGPRPSVGVFGGEGGGAGSPRPPRGE